MLKSKLEVFIYVFISLFVNFHHCGYIKWVMKKSLYFVSVLYVSVLCQGNQKKVHNGAPIGKNEQFHNISKWMEV